jgi:hypothetical protein
MQYTELLSLDRAELSALIEHHLRYVHSLPDGDERQMHLKRAEQLNAMLEPALA